MFGVKDLRINHEYIDATSFGSTKTYLVGKVSAEYELVSDDQKMLERLTRPGQKVTVMEQELTIRRVTIHISATNPKVATAFVVAD